MQCIDGEFATHHMNQVLPEGTRAASSPSAFLHLAVSYSSLKLYLTPIPVPALHASDMRQQISVLFPLECCKAGQLQGEQDTLPSAELSVIHGAYLIPWGLGCSGQLSGQELQN